MLVGCLSCSVAKKGGKIPNAVDNLWQATPIVVDGDSKDWPSPYPNFDSKAKIAYATSNDLQYLYVTFETGDELTQAKILKAGVRLCIDTTGRKNAAQYISYPLANTLEEFDIQPAKDDGANGAAQMVRKTNQFVKKSLDQASQLAIDGLVGCSGGYAVSQTLPCGVKVKIRMDEYKELVWEAAIPIAAITGNKMLTVANAGTTWAVCFELNGITKPKGQGVDNINNNMTQGNGSMGGARSGTAASMNSMQGGSMNNGNNPLDLLYTTTKTWKVFRLAVKG